MPTSPKAPLAIQPIPTTDLSAQLEGFPQQEFLRKYENYRKDTESGGVWIPGSTNLELYRYLGQDLRVDWKPAKVRNPDRSKGEDWPVFWEPIRPHNKIFDSIPADTLFSRLRVEYPEGGWFQIRFCRVGQSNPLRPPIMLFVSEAEDEMSKAAALAKQAMQAQSQHLEHVVKEKNELEQRLTTIEQREAAREAAERERKEKELEENLETTQKELEQMTEQKRSENDSALGLAFRLVERVLPNPQAQPQPDIKEAVREAVRQEMGPSDHWGSPEPEPWGGAPRRPAPWPNRPTPRQLGRPQHGFPRQWEPAEESPRLAFLEQRLEQQDARLERILDHIEKKETQEEKPKTFQDKMMERMMEKVMDQMLDPKPAVNPATLPAATTPMAELAAHLEALERIRGQVGGDADPAPPPPSTMDKLIDNFGPLLLLRFLGGSDGLDPEMIKVLPMLSGMMGGGNNQQNNNQQNNNQLDTKEPTPPQQQQLPPHNPQTNTSEPNQPTEGLNIPPHLESMILELIEQALESGQTPEDFINGLPMQEQIMPVLQQIRDLPAKIREKSNSNQVHSMYGRQWLDKAQSLIHG